MDERDHSILTQVAFKAAIECEKELDLATDEGQSRFEQVFNYLHNSLMASVNAAVEPSQRAANLVHANFPGTQQVANGGYQQAPPQQQYVGGTAPQPMSGGIIIKGSQHGPLPDWLIQAAAEKGVSEIYDNRDRAMGTKRPWFRAVHGGDNAPAFWPPR